MASDESPLIVGISGASGVVLGVRLLAALAELGVPRHLIMTKPAEMTLALETDHQVAEVRALADAHHPITDVGAAPASGSFRARGMVVVPCSMRTLAEVATGVTSNLLTRTADVTLKERRRLVLAPRETPLHLGHLRNMVAVTEMGAIVAPPVPGFYARPADLDQLIDHTVGRLLDLFDLDSGRVGRWQGGRSVTASRRGR